MCGSHSTRTASVDTNHGPILWSRQPELSPTPLQLHPCVYLTVTLFLRLHRSLPPPPTFAPTLPPCTVPATWKERQINLMVVESNWESEGEERERENEHASVNVFILTFFTILFVKMKWRTNKYFHCFTKYQNNVLWPLWSPVGEFRQRSPPPSS